MLWDKIAKEHGFESKQAMFICWYLTNKESVRQIADRLKVGSCTVLNHLEDLGIERRSRGGDNKKIDQSYKLFHLDQRIVLNCKAKIFHKLIKVSYTFLYKYQRRRAPNGVLHNQSSSGVENLGYTQQPPLTAAASSAS